MKNSLTYLTRRCPRQCGYCALRDATNVGKELEVTQWIEAFNILKGMGVEFNLILGNETWLLGDGIITILEANKVPFALYTTAPEPWFTKYRRKFFDSGVLDNFSCGIDYPRFDNLFVDDDSFRKSQSAIDAFKWMRNEYPDVDTHGTITVHKQNLKYLNALAGQLSYLGVFYAVNFIHWNSDGGFDFFPGKDKIQDLLFTPEDFPEVTRVLNQLLENPGLLQSPEVVKIVADNPELLQMKWHCKGDPYGGPTIDSDGHLRCCGYRRGRFTPHLTIFDLPGEQDLWRESVRMDAAECPGCVWLYPMQLHYWEKTDPEMGKKVFAKHAGAHIKESKWSNRIIE